MKDMKKLVFIALLNVSLSFCVSAQNVGIGTNTPAYKLDVVGTVHSTGTLTVGSDVNASGNVNAGGNVTTPGSVNAGGNVTTSANVTANGNVNATGDVTAHGGGVLYNTVSGAGVPVSTNLKVYYRTASFTVTGLGAHSVSVEGTVGIGGGFTSPPMVFIGDITANTATAGPLYQLQLIPYGSTTNSFKIRILNTSGVTISQSITWNIMCIGR